MRRLTVARYLLDATGMSTTKIARTLQPLQRIAGHDPLAQNPFTDTARRILNDLGNPAQ